MFRAGPGVPKDGEVRAIYISDRHREDDNMIKTVKSGWLAAAGASILCLAPVWFTNAQTPAQGPAFPIYCRGPLSTLRTDGGKVIRTPFKWAKEAAIKERPGAGQCAWADATPPGIESKPGDSAAIIGNLGPFDTLPVGTVAKFCVSKASGKADELVVRQILRQLGHQTAPYHIPPFSADGCA